MFARHGERCSAVQHAGLERRHVLPHPANRLQERGIRRRVRLHQLAVGDAQAVGVQAHPVELLGVVEQGVAAARAHVLADALDDLHRRQGLAENLLGQEGQGFIYLMQNLPQERISIAIMAIAAMEQVLDATLQYTKERKAFGKPIGSFQNSRFLLAELATEATVVRVMVDEFIRLHLDKKLTAEQAAMAKWYSTEKQVHLIDRCLQLHGGYGYMREYPIARAYLDARVQTIYGGTTEIMKEIVGRSLGV